MPAFRPRQLIRQLNLSRGRISRIQTATDSKGAQNRDDRRLGVAATGCPVAARGVDQWLHADLLWGVGQLVGSDLKDPLKRKSRLIDDRGIQDRSETRHRRLVAAVILLK